MRKVEDNGRIRPLIMIIDDDHLIIRELVGIMIPDYDITTAVSGIEALTHISQGFIPDLILLDIMMPGVDGFGICRRLKKFERIN